MFVIVGPPDPESDDNLYWSNEWGWGSFEGCTQFGTGIFHHPLPHEATGIQSVINGERGEFFKLAPMGGGVPI